MCQLEPQASYMALRPIFIEYGSMNGSGNSPAIGNVDDQSLARPLIPGSAKRIRRSGPMSSVSKLSNEFSSEKLSIGPNTPPGMVDENV